MGANFRDVGVACVAASGSRHGSYWTMNLGRPR
jgi:uncharacterized protein YkwD